MATRELAGHRMKPNEVYFHRNRGSWDWAVDFKISSYRTLWQSNLKFASKVRVSALAIARSMLGPFEMWTNVDFLESESKVRHSTKLSKYGPRDLSNAARRDFLRLSDCFRKGRRAH